MTTFAHFAVALVIATGIINTFPIVGDIPSDWSFLYQQLLSAKIALVAVMTALAVINRYGLVPRLSRSPRAAAALVWFTAAEIVLGLAALGLVAWLGTLEPN